MHEQVANTDARSHNTASVANPRRVRVGHDGHPLSVLSPPAGDDSAAAKR